MTDNITHNTTLGLYSSIWRTDDGRSFSADDYEHATDILDVLKDEMSAEDYIATAFMPEDEAIYFCMLLDDNTLTYGTIRPCSVVGRTVFR